MRVDEGKGLVAGDGHPGPGWEEQARISRERAGWESIGRERAGWERAGRESIGWLSAVGEFCCRALERVEVDEAGQQL